MNRNCALSADKLIGIIRGLLTEFGLPLEHAEFVSRTLVVTSLFGIDTHGVELVPTYLQELRGGRALADPPMEILDASPALISLDAKSALGVVAGNVAVRLAIRRAKEFGIAAVAVKNSNHFGAAGYYSNFAAEQGMLCFVFTNSDALVAPYGGEVPLNGTNPIAFTAKGKGADWFHLDMATSQVSFTKVKQCLEAGGEVRRDWAITRASPEFPQFPNNVVLAPLGGYKGQGLGMLVQILCCLLTGMPLDHELHHLFGPPFSIGRQVGHFFVCINIEGLVSRDEFKGRLSTLIDLFHGSGNHVVPGDPEAAMLSQRRKSGIPISQMLYDSLEPFLER